MVTKIILFSLHNRLIVLSLAVFILVAGVVAANRSPLDIFPEFSPPLVEVQTEAPGLSAEEVEALITIPLEYALNGTTTLRINPAEALAHLLNHITGCGRCERRWFFHQVALSIMRVVSW